MENDLTFVCISDTHGYNIPLPPGDVLIHCGDFTKNGQKEETLSFIQWLIKQPFKYKIVIAGNHDVSLDTENYQSKLKEYHHKVSNFNDQELLQKLKDNCIYCKNQFIFQNRSQRIVKFNSLFYYLFIDFSCQKQYLYTYLSLQFTQIQNSMNNNVNFYFDFYQIQNLNNNFLLYYLRYLLNSSIVIEGIKIWGSPYSLEYHTWAFQLKSENAEVFWSQIEEDSDIIVTHGPPLNHGDQAENFQGKKNHVGDEALLKRVLKIKPKYHLFGHIHESYGETEEEGVKFIVKLNI